MSLLPEVIGFLKKQQQGNGSFLSYSTADSDDFSRAVPYQTVFSTALILSNLHYSDSPEANSIKRKAAKFLLSQRSKNWTFNYWNRTSPQYRALPYPDDLDDTFCSLAALQLYDPTLISGDVLAKSVQLLTELEAEEGGPYKTWIVDETADPIWQDVDLAVNSNVAYFLFLNKIELPNLTELIEKAISKGQFTSPYYPNAYPILYFISRSYRGSLMEQIVEYLLQKQKKGYWKNPLYTALAVTTLLKSGYPAQKLESSVEYIKKHLADPKPYPFYTGINPKRDSVYYAGSAALTTAMSVEALLLYEKHLNATKLHLEINRHFKKPEDIHKTVLQKIDNRMSSTSADIQTTISAIINKLRKTDNDVQIILLPYLFYTTLKNPQNKLPNDFFIKLGCANLYGWIAYTIYDDFLDDEGEPSMLPAANVCLRELTSIFESILPVSIGFREIFHKILDEIDSANAWETKNARFDPSQGHLPTEAPDYKDLSQLANKSLGHALGPIAILYALGFSEKDKEVKKLIEFFKHYLIARQLNDDAHDWESDLKAGQINAVAAMLLKHQALQNTTAPQQRNLNFKKLEEIFWLETVIESSELMLSYVEQAEKALASNPIIVQTELYQKLLDPIKQSAHKVLTEQAKAQEFIYSYDSSIAS